MLPFLHAHSSRHLVPDRPEQWHAQVAYSEPFDYLHAMSPEETALPVNIMSCITVLNLVPAMMTWLAHFECGMVTKPLQVTNEKSIL